MVESMYSIHNQQSPDCNVPMRGDSCSSNSNCSSSSSSLHSLNSLHTMAANEELYTIQSEWKSSANTLKNALDNLTSTQLNTFSLLNSQRSINSITTRPSSIRSSFSSQTSAHSDPNVMEISSFSKTSASSKRSRSPEESFHSKHARHSSVEQLRIRVADLKPTDYSRSETSPIEQRRQQTDENSTPITGRRFSQAHRPSLSQLFSTPSPLSPNNPVQNGNICLSPAAIGGLVKEIGRLETISASLYPPHMNSSTFDININQLEDMISRFQNEWNPNLLMLNSNSQLFHQLPADVQPFAYYTTRKARTWLLGFAVSIAVQLHSDIYHLIDQSNYQFLNSLDYNSTVIIRERVKTIFMKLNDVLEVTSDVNSLSADYYDNICSVNNDHKTHNNNTCNNTTIGESSASASKPNLLLKKIYELASVLFCNSLGLQKADMGKAKFVEIYDTLFTSLKSLRMMTLILVSDSIGRGLIVLNGINLSLHFHVTFSRCVLESGLFILSYISKIMTLSSANLVISKPHYIGTNERKRNADGETENVDDIWTNLAVKFVKEVIALVKTF